MFVMSLPKESGVHAIVNSRNDKKLICFSKNMKRNAEICIGHLNRGDGYINSFLQEDWDTNSDDITVELLELTNDKNRVYYYMRKYNSIEDGYNTKFKSDSRLYKHLPNESGVYQLLNTVNGKIYIGFSSNMQRRVRDHFGDLRRGSHYTSDLQNDWDLGHRFIAGTLELTTDVTKEEVYIKMFKTHLSNGYNLRAEAVAHGKNYIRAVE